MSNTIVVRTEIEIPGHPTAIHIAEMEELASPTSAASAALPDGAAGEVPMCRILRIIELAGTAGGETVTGAGVLRGPAFGLANEPNEIVPHPDTYADFPDIKARIITVEEFEGLWLEAGAKFPGLA